MHDFNSQIANTTASVSFVGWISAHLAGIESGAQIIVSIFTIGAMCWSMWASRAKQRAYDRLHQDNP